MSTHNPDPDEVPFNPAAFFFSGANRLYSSRLTGRRFNKVAGKLVDVPEQIGDPCPTCKMPNHIPNLDYKFAQFAELQFDWDPHETHLIQRVTVLFARRMKPRTPLVRNEPPLLS